MSYQHVNTLSIRQFHRFIIFAIQILALVLLAMKTAMGGTDSLVAHNTFLEPDNEFHFEVGIDSLYMAQGRNQLDDGGMVWGHVSHGLGYINLYSTAGRATHQDYTELTIGMQYLESDIAEFELSFGFQLIEIFASERESDLEIIALLAYSGFDWFTPSVEHTYSLEADGHFVEVSLHGMSLDIVYGGTLTPYLTQAFDFEFALDEYNGPNHFQLGLEAVFPISPRLHLFGHLSHITPQAGIKREADIQARRKINVRELRELNRGVNDVTERQFFAGLYFNWSF
ncbi:hypothetical protein FM038_25585 [Shewanella eurypsychrophilus]|uniref:Uncharacterized protein n=1 Tax=Shewanella eurypsychrophilus TaxID=2593656 RepID=A0ABX8S2L7_9GAMM|nr:MULTISPECIES: hypothetical protein [Shewanella]QFU23234.1 hypothetical protein FS418_16080 [Shewanella sp. YLB-09]QXP44827.1 hypothetical protein FM038_25585 [Shewanella eurypsychrophilus]